MIGLFDSGSGGLTVLQQLREVLPSADVVYFGDIGNAPYGSKSRAELSRLTIKAIELLQGRGATSIISACNSVSASMAVSLFDIFSLKPAALIEMVGPTVSYFRESDARILLCATPATIESGVYQQAFQMIGKDITAVALPELASAIEFGAPESVLRAHIAAGLGGYDSQSFDVLVLACTHYPLVGSLFEEAVGPSVEVFDPAIAVAERAQTLLWPREVAGGSTTFIISQDSAPFRALVAKLFPDSSSSIEVLQ